MRLKGIRHDLKANRIEQVEEEIDDKVYQELLERARLEAEREEIETLIAQEMRKILRKQAIQNLMENPEIAEKIMKLKEKGILVK